MPSDNAKYRFLQVLCKYFLYCKLRNVSFENPFLKIKLEKKCDICCIYTPDTPDEKRNKSRKFRISKLGHLQNATSHKLRRLKKQSNLK